MASQQVSLYRFVKLGMNIEYLRGVSSVSTMPDKRLAAFPRLVDNLPPNRYRVINVVEVLRSLFIQLEELSLERTLAEAQQLVPLLQQMEEYLAENTDPTQAFMTDSFADRLVFYVNQLHLCLKTETAAKLASF
jgi:hypothetical protein